MPNFKYIRKHSTTIGLLAIVAILLSWLLGGEDGFVSLLFISISTSLCVGIYYAFKKFESKIVFWISGGLGFFAGFNIFTKQLFVDMPETVFYRVAFAGILIAVLLVVCVLFLGFIAQYIYAESKKVGTVKTAP